MRDILHIFHHPALRDDNLEVHRNMFATVRKWVEEQPDAHNLNNILSSSSVKAGHNHKSEGTTGTKGVHDHSHGALGGHGKTSGSIWSEIQSRDLMSLEGGDSNPNHPSFVSTPPQPGSPAFSQSHSPSYGYHNTRPGTSGGYGGSRPSSSGGHLAPNPPYSSFHAGPVPEYLQDYGGSGSGYPQQPPYGGPPPNQGGYGGGAPPYPTEQTYGGQNPYQHGPPPGGEYWNQGGPPQQQPPYGGQQYPPQHQQPPYGGGGGGGYPGAGYGGGRY